MGRKKKRKDKRSSDDWAGTAAFRSLCPEHDFLTTARAITRARIFKDKTAH
jgi:hypothetical protein